MQTTVPVPAMLGSQAERSGLHAVRQNTPSGRSWSRHKTEGWGNDGGGRKWRSCLKHILGVFRRKKGIGTWAGGGGIA